jgi:hypothetical protein
MVVGRKTFWITVSARVNILCDKKDMTAFVVEYLKKFYVVRGHEKRLSNFDLKKVIKKAPSYLYRFDATHKARRLSHVFNIRKVSLR